jgi:hypothetical protein
MSTLPGTRNAQFFYPCFKSCALNPESSGETRGSADDPVRESGSAVSERLSKARRRRMSWKNLPENFRAIRTSSRFSKKNHTPMATNKTHQVLLSVRSGAGYRGQLLSNRLITAEEITAASVNGSTTSTANHGPGCSRAGNIAKATPGG